MNNWTRGQLESEPHTYRGPIVIINYSHFLQLAASGFSQQCISLHALEHDTQNMEPAVIASVEEDTELWAWEALGIWLWHSDSTLVPVLVTQWQQYSVSETSSSLDLEHS